MKSGRSPRSMYNTSLIIYQRLVLSIVDIEFSPHVKNDVGEERPIERRDQSNRHRRTNRGGSSRFWSRRPSQRVSPTSPRQDRASHCPNTADSVFTRHGEFHFVGQHVDNCLPVNKSTTNRNPLRKYRFSILGRASSIARIFSGNFGNIDNQVRVSTNCTSLGCKFSQCSCKVFASSIGVR